MAFPPLPAQLKYYTGPRDPWQFVATFPTVYSWTPRDHQWLQRPQSLENKAGNNGSYTNSSHILLHTTQHNTTTDML